ncbi:hypothetical protein, partial [Prevotella histicola]|uniref:hypothetical protein n=1 Tax=Prevotella histicola TaxID=470565 RepID=UPI001C5EE783
ECGITYIKTIPQGFICYLSFTGQQYFFKYLCIMIIVHHSGQMPLCPCCKGCGSERKGVPVKKQRQ